MSTLHSCTRADYLPWGRAMQLVRRLYEDGEYRMSLLVGCGCFFGLRISDIGFAVPLGGSNQLYDFCGMIAPLTTNTNKVLSL